jgi:uncharacterized protein (DUF934 family)
VLTASGGWVEDGGADPVPLAAFLAEPEAGGRTVLLEPTDDPATLAPHVGRLDLVAIRFPTFGDGRGYSIATLLRRRYGYAGELRAVGDVLVDQLFALKRVGFTSFAVRPDQDRARAVQALATFSDAYQASVDQPLPLFRRHVRPPTAGRPA